jgi:methyl-accepting chemotaxis protein
MKDLNLSRKFVVTFGVICLLTVLQGAGALTGLLRIDRLTKDLTERTMVAAQALTEMRGQMQTVRRVELASLLCRDAACEVKYPPMRTKALAKYQAAKESFESVVTEARDLEAFHATTNSFSVYLGKSDAIVKVFLAANEQDDGSVARREQDLLGDFNTALNSAIALTSQYENLSRENGAKVVEANRVVRWLESGLVLLVLALSVGIGVMLTRSIVPPILDATAALEHVAKKNLTVSVAVRDQSEIGRLSAALNTTVASIRDVIASVEKSASILSASAEELSAQSAQTKTNTESQTNQTNQIAAAAQEMTATIAEIGHNAETASTASRASAETAVAGGQVMQASSETMEKIVTATAGVAEKMNSLAQRSVEIGRVLSVIQEISEQTNLLALNAAIEAARAGEHGRGFTVVAGEVRRLAERTTGATKEIAQTIQTMQGETQATLAVMEQSREMVERGLEENTRARTSLEAIIEGSRNVEQMIHLIATAATEQTAASAEISSSAANISNLAGENTRAAGEAAEESAGLSRLAADLDGIIRGFCLVDGKCDGDNPSSRLIDFTQAIEAHAKWKTKLAAYIAHPDRSLNAETTSKDTACPLGRWMHGEGRQHAGLIEFKRAFEDHARFHAAAGAIIRKADSGQRLTDDLALGGRSEYAAASQAVVTALLQLKKKLAA